MKTLKVLLFSIGLLGAGRLARAEIQVVTTTEDLAALAREVGGERVAVSAIARGYQDPHMVEPKPSYLLRLKKADLFIQVGLELEVAWAPALLTSARNLRILPGRDGFMDASEGCEILQKPAGRVDRSMGDVHPLGNPHYWLDPANGRTIARGIAQRLAALDAAGADTYRKNLSAFESRLDAKEKEWKEQAAPLKGLKVVTYHNSWPNFARHFGLEVVNFIEPRPGIPPSPAHVHALVEQIRADRVSILLVEPYFDDKLPKKIAQESGARLLILPPSVGGGPGGEEIRTYFDLFDYDLRRLREAMSGEGEKP